MGLADGQLIALSPHVLDENAKVQQAATGNLERVFLAGLFNLQSDIAFQFLEQPFTQIAAGDVLAFLADEG